MTLSGAPRQPVILIILDHFAASRAGMTEQWPRPRLRSNRRKPVPLRGRVSRVAVGRADRAAEIRHHAGTDKNRKTPSLPLRFHVVT